MLGRKWNWFGLLALSISMTLLSVSISFAQDGDGGDDGDEEDPEPQVGGVVISGDGLLTARKAPANSRALNQRRFAAAKAKLNQDLQRATKLRKVSLTRLEAEAAKLLAAGKRVPDDMRYLAGMTKITHVFYYPETHDIVIAGPAEGFFFNAENFVVGMESGRATLKLEDLAVALRAFAPNQNKPSVITCSIDPTQEGLVRYQKVINQMQRRLASGNTAGMNEQTVVEAYKTALGPQKITITGRVAEN